MRISACIIAKNEEKNLPRLLNSIKGKFDEVILVDTGSKDRTVEIAESFGCKVVKHKWAGFADARNRAVDEATGDWIWHFDADFELEGQEYRKALYILKNVPEEIDGLMIGVKNLDMFGNVKAISSHIFIHRNKQSIRWSGKVHETPNVKNIVGVPVFVNHYGYADVDLLLKKAERNIELLKDEISHLEKSSREYGFKLFYLIQSYTILSSIRPEYLKEAKDYIEKFLSLAEEKRKELGFYYLYVYTYYLHILKQLNDLEKYEEVLVRILEKDYKIPDFYIYAYYLYKEKGDLLKALENLRKAAEIFDRTNDNPFFYNLHFTFASDKVKHFELIVVNENLENARYEKILEREWKKKGGRNLGLLLCSVCTSKEKKLKFMKKLALRYTDLVTVSWLIKELEEQGKKEEMLRLRKLLSPRLKDQLPKIMGFTSDNS